MQELIGEPLLLLAVHVSIVVPTHDHVVVVENATQSDVAVPHGVDQILSRLLLLLRTGLHGCLVLLFSIRIEWLPS